MQNVDRRPITLLTQEIEDSFLAKMKAGAVFVDLTAGNNTVRHCGLPASFCVFSGTGT